MNLNELLDNLEKTASIEKKASVEKPEVSADLAGILEKKASEDIMKQAMEQGEALARQFLSKMATEIQMDNDQMVAQDNTKIVPTETGGTIEQVLEGTLNQAVERGATTDDRVDALKDAGKGPDAGEPINKEANEMNKTAQENKSLADFIMEKLAQEFSAEVTTPAAQVNVAAAPVPNKIQIDNATMTAQDDAKVQGIVPGGDGTINALYETIVARAQAQGGGSDDLINGEAATPRQTQGIDGTPATGEETEKAAAVSALCEAGLDFDTAVNLVKQAEQEILADEWEQEKQGALNALVAEGVDFDVAIDLVKSAEASLFEEIEKEAGASEVYKSAKGIATQAFKGAKTDVSAAGKIAKEVATGKTTFKNGTQRAVSRMGAAKNLMGTHTAKAVAVGGAVGAGAAMSNEKKACFDQLVAEGFDFDTAAELTKAAGLQVYGE